ALVAGVAVVGVVGVEGEGGCGEVVRPGPEVAVRVPLGVGPEQGSGTGEHREREERGQDPEEEKDDPSRLPTGASRRRRRSWFGHGLRRELALGLTVLRPE